MLILKGLYQFRWVFFGALMISGMMFAPWSLKSWQAEFAWWIGLLGVGLIWVLIESRRVTGSGPWVVERPSWVRWTESALLTSLFALLYFGPDWIWSPMLRWINDLFACAGAEAGKWHFYSWIYTCAVLIFGIRSLTKYRRSVTQTKRMVCLISVQLLFAFFLPILIPAWLDKTISFNLDIKYFWPLNSTFFEPNNLDAMLASGALGRLALIWGVVMFLVITPWATYRWGKGWYCAYVCGCGALAETVGDVVRHYNQPNQNAWKWERVVIYLVLGWVALSTIVVLGGYMFETQTLFGISIYAVFARPYAFWVSSLFSGVLGVGFYPILGNRFWCRYGCPLAAYMGWIQKWKSRFRIETDAASCISCGACTAACEMGINVHDYAEQGERIQRAACVGCGMCEMACPRSAIFLTDSPWENHGLAPSSNPIHFADGKFEISSGSDVN